jgi:hypothetical protein
MTVRTEQSVPRTYLVSPDTIRQLQEIEEKFHLNKSDSVRRGVDMVYNYLILGKSPKESYGKKS